MLRMLLLVFTTIKWLQIYSQSGLCCCRVRGSSRSDQAAKADREGRTHGRLIDQIPEISGILILDQLVVVFL